MTRRQKDPNNHSLLTNTVPAGVFRTILLLSCCFAVVVYIWGVFYAGSSSGQNRPKFLLNANELELKKAFFSDTPHIFYCHEHGNRDYIPKKLETAHQLLGEEYQLAVLNCSQVLKSGKRIFDRFKLKSSWSPVVFATAPWSPRTQVQVPPAKLSREALHIASYLSSALAPREKTLVNDKEFQDSCGGSADTDTGNEIGGEVTCILALKGPLFSDPQDSTIKALVKTFHRKKMPVVSVDSKVRWLSEEATSSVSRKYSMRLFAIRNGTHYMPLIGSPTRENAIAFVKRAIQAPPSDFISSRSNLKLVKPAVSASSARAGGSDVSRKRRSESAGRKEVEPPNSGSSSSRDPSDLDVVFNNDAQRRKEQERREEMDKQNNVFILNDAVEEDFDEINDSPYYDYDVDRVDEDIIEL